MAARIDATILEVAARTGGVCTRAGLRAAGVAERTITARVNAGFMVRSGPGLYTLPALATEQSPLFLAALAYQDGVLSHLAAARLWGLPVPPVRPGDAIDVTRPHSASQRRPLPGIRLHATRRWAIGETSRVTSGLPVTSPARTLMDLAGTELGERRLRHVAQAALTAGVVTESDLSSHLQQVGGRGVPGSARLRRLLTDLGWEGPVPQSQLEWRLAELLDRRFHRQYRPPWYDGTRGIVDFAEPVSRVIVEADGRRWHATEQAMTEDRRRDRQAAGNGWVVLRVVWDDLVRRPLETAADIDAVVAQRSQPSAAWHPAGAPTRGTPAFWPRIQAGSCREPDPESCPGAGGGEPGAGAGAATPVGQATTARQPQPWVA